MEPIDRNWADLTRYRRIIGEIYRTDQPWRDDAACKGMSPSIFYDLKSYSQAREICSQCPVVDPCREAGAALDEPGFWGNMTQKDRQKLRRGRLKKLEGDHADLET